MTHWFGLYVDWMARLIALSCGSVSVPENCIVFIVVIGGNEIKFYSKLTINGTHFDGIVNVVNIFGPAAQS